MSAGGAEIFWRKKIIHMFGEEGRNGNRDLPAGLENAAQLGDSQAVIIDVFDDLGADDLMEGSFQKGKTQSIAPQEKGLPIGLFPRPHLPQNISSFQKTLLAEVHAQNGTVMPEALEDVAALSASRIQHEVPFLQRQLVEVNREHRSPPGTLPPSAGPRSPR